MKALKTHVKLLISLIEGESNQNEISAGDLRVTMLSTNHGFYGDVVFCFYHRNTHVLTYKADLAYGKPKPGIYDFERTLPEYTKLLKQLKAALVETGHLPTAEYWVTVVTNENDMDEVTYEGPDEFQARVSFACNCAEGLTTKVMHYAAGDWEPNVVDFQD